MLTSLTMMMLMSLTMQPQNYTTISKIEERTKYANTERFFCRELHKYFPGLVCGAYKPSSYIPDVRHTRATKH
jgi:hypothetical protein